MKRTDAPPKEIVRDQTLLRAWVIYQLSIRGSSLAAVGRRAGTCRQVVYQAFLKPYPRMEKFIADALGLQPQDLWPDRYDEYGLPKRRRRGRKKAA